MQNKSQISFKKSVSLFEITLAKLSRDTINEHKRTKSWTTTAVWSWRCHEKMPNKTIIISTMHHFTCRSC